MEGSVSDIVKKALKVMEQNVEKLKDGAGDLGWCLECFYAAGITKENPVVKTCIEELVNSQQEDGSWISADGSQYTIPVTINAMNVLKKYRVW